MAKFKYVEAVMVAKKEEQGEIGEESTRNWRNQSFDTMLMLMNQWENRNETQKTEEMHSHFLK